MTMVIRILGGRRSMVEAPMLIFTNGNSNYPIRYQWYYLTRYHTRGMLSNWPKGLDGLGIVFSIF
jgi:hypothetical protein